VARVDWQQVHEDGYPVPTDLPLTDLTTELTTMLGEPDPRLRDEVAYPVLATWVGRGVYDDLLPGLGDGMAAGLLAGLGETGTDTVFRRSFSALVLAECVARDNARPVVLGGKILQWGDALAAWLLREQDLRAFVPGRGWAHAVAHGADAVGVVAASPHLAAPELTVLLDVVADRVLAPAAPFSHGEPDRLAAAVLAVLRRELVPLTVLEPWVNRVSAQAAAADTLASRDPFGAAVNPQSFLRALYLALALGPRPPRTRADLMLVLVGALRSTNASLRGA